MLIYEKDNKLNINFDNEISENPDLQIGKDGDKTEVLIDGQPGGGSSGIEPINITATISFDSGTGTWSGATWDDLKSAYSHNQAGVNFQIGSVQQHQWFTSSGYNTSTSKDGLSFNYGTTVIFCFSDNTVQVAQ